MPKRSKPPYFVLMCSDSELRRHLKVCKDSDFRVTQDKETVGVNVYDRETLILRTEHFGGSWLVWLHLKYYRHPFGPPSDGNALPGVA